MVSNVNRENWSLSDLQACMYCKKNNSGNRVMTCGDIGGPNYGKIVEYLDELPLRGCENIKYNGKKIPAFLFKNIPTDSYLRTIPLEELVRVEVQEDLFNLQTDLSSKLTVQDIFNGAKLDTN